MTATLRLRLWIAGIAVAVTVIAIQSAADMATVVGQRAAITAASSDLASLSRFDGRLAASGGSRMEPTDPAWASWAAVAGPAAESVERARSWLDRIDHVALAGGDPGRAADVRWYVRKAAAELRAGAAVNSNGLAASWQGLSRNLLLAYILLFGGALGVYLLKVLPTRGITVVTTRSATREELKPVELPGLELAHVRHELRTPLTVMMGYAAELEGLVDGDAREFARTIRQAGTRLNDTLEQLMTYAELTDHEASLVSEPVEVHQVVEKVISRLRPTAFDKRLSFVYRATKEDAWVRTSPEAIETAIAHLVENALKYTEKGSVVVSVECDNGKVRVAVEDTGVGFDEARLAELAAPFQQGSRGDSRKHEGIGLGLTIARSVAESSGGRLTASSLKGVGSRFAITMPQITEATVTPIRRAA
ncbi:MAG: HAMP domain-containing histidine kinase [Rhodothermales bacterium]|nr:HAMP domain-containing histidine kinase [Rhodothermales bacterium]MBO6781322.1 HAMP domain-containing histidine kinase [Rhodothermales bacterium]